MYREIGDKYLTWTSFATLGDMNSVAAEISKNAPLLDGKCWSLRFMEEIPGKSYKTR